MVVRAMRRRRRRSASWTLATPAGFVVIPFMTVVVGMGIWMAVHGENLTEPGSEAKFVGTRNFLRAFSDPTLAQSLVVTLLYVVGAVTVELVVGSAVALAMQHALPGKGIARALVLVPMVLTPVVAALTWRLLLDPTSGTVNWVLGQIGLGSHHDFLANPRTALATVVMVDIWQNTSYVVTIVLAGLESLDPAPFEAAQLDGANRWQTIRYLTLPMMRPVISIALLLRLIDAAKTFALVQTMTGGGPGTSTLAISSYVYRVGFQVFNVGYSAALAVLMSVAVVVLVFPVARRLLSDDGSETRGPA